jgi:hypothetical protein
MLFSKSVSSVVAVPTEFFRFLSGGLGGLSTALLLVLLSPTQVASFSGAEIGLEATKSSPNEIVFVDQGLPDLAVLLAGIDAGAEIILLDPSRDGIDQIAEALRGREGIKALHILSHGSAGSVQLGDSILNLDNLDAYAEQLQGWGAALDPNADILLYGCNVAAGSEGELFIEQLAHLTQADIAASNNATGHPGLGGDWDLEFQVGEAQQNTLLSTDILSSWKAILQVETVLDVQFNPLNFGTNFTDPSSTQRIYTNILPGSSPRVDAVIDLTFNNLTLNSIDDNNSNLARLQPRLNSPGTPPGSVTYDITLQDEFGNPIALNNFALTGIDIDGNREFYIISGFTEYVVDASTQLTITEGPPGTVRFDAQPGENDGISFTNSSAFIANFTTPVSSFSVTVGLSLGGGGVRQFSFSLGIPGDGNAFTNPVSFPVNSPPLAVNDSEETDQGVPVDVLVLDNDIFNSNPANPPFFNQLDSLSLTLEPSNGSAVLSNNGTPADPTDDFFVYTPNSGFFGTDTFTYTITDTDGDSASAVVTVTVNEVVEPEILVSGDGNEIVDGDTTPDTADFTTFIPTTVDTPTTRDFVIANTGSADLTLGTLSLPSGYSIVGTNPSGSTITAGNSVTFTVQLDAGAIGTFDGEISIPNNDSDEDPYNFAITGVVNAVPAPEIVVSGDGNEIVDGDTTPDTADFTTFISTTVGTPTTRDFVIENTGNADLTLGTLSLPSGYSIVGTNPSGSTITAGNSVTFTVQLDAGATGTFDGEISIPNNDSDENPYNFAITGVVTTEPQSPIANDDTTATNPGQPILIPVLTNDIDPNGNLDPTSVTITSGPANGTVSIDPLTGSITYTPNPGFTGTDTFTYQVCDTSTPPLCDTATVRVTVGAAPTPSPGETDTAITPLGTPIQVDPLTNNPPGSDPLDPTSVTIPNPPTNGTVTVDPVTGVITYTPNPGFTGTDTFIYEICDTNPTPLCIRVPVTVTVVEVRLVKRITAIDGIPISGYVDDPTDPNDDPGIAWPGGSAAFLQGGINQTVGSSSTVQFSISFLLNPAPSGFLVCDPLSPGFNYSAGSLSVRRTGQPITVLSDGQDGDAGAFIPAGMPVPEGCGGIPNPNGVVVVTIEDGSPGIIRFEVTAPD